MEPNSAKRWRFDKFLENTLDNEIIMHYNSGSISMPT